MLGHLHDGDQGRHGLTGQGEVQTGQFIHPVFLAPTISLQNQSYAGQRFDKGLSNLSLKLPKGEGSTPSPGDLLQYLMAGSRRQEPAPSWGKARSRSKDGGAQLLASA